MDQFKLHQTLFLDFIDKKRDVGPFYIKELDEESCSIILKDNDYDYNIISIDNMLLDGKHEIDVIQMMEPPKLNKKTVYIPFVHKKTTKEIIKDVLDEFNWGAIHSIDMVKNIYNSHHNAV